MSTRRGILAKDGLSMPPVDRNALPAHCRYVLLHVAAQLTGYTVKAMQRKIERGDWIEDRVWKRAPDGRIFIDLKGFERWVEGL